jgi:hypothetical protein
LIDSQHRYFQLEAVVSELKAKKLRLEIDALEAVAEQ